MKISPFTVPSIVFKNHYTQFSKVQFSFFHSFSTSSKFMFVHSLQYFVLKKSTGIYSIKVKFINLVFWLHFWQLQSWGGSDSRLSYPITSTWKLHNTFKDLGVLGGSRRYGWYYWNCLQVALLVSCRHSFPCAGLSWHIP